MKLQPLNNGTKVRVLTQPHDKSTSREIAGREVGILSRSETAVGWLYHVKPLLQVYQPEDNSVYDLWHADIEYIRVNYSSLFGLDEIIGGPRQPAELNNDVDTGDRVRALHRVVRAMHDGECPKCHALVDAETMRSEHDGHICTNCDFMITSEEATAVMAAFASIMEKNLAIFEQWRAARK